MPFSSKKVVCSMAAVFCAGHSGRGMWKDGKKRVGIVRKSWQTRALGSAEFPGWTPSVWAACSVAGGAQRCGDEARGMLALGCPSAATWTFENR